MNAGGPADVLILGGGIAGVTTATTLRDLDYRGAITIVEASASCTDHPPLSKEVLVSGATLEDLDLLSPERATALSVKVLTGTAVVEVDAEENSVHLADGRALKAEAIVVAVGAEAKPLAGHGNNARILTLRGYDDAMTIRACTGAGRTVLVVGGGFVGAEVAAALHERGTHVILIGRHEIPGADVMGDTLAGWLHAMHAEHGIDVRCTQIDAITSNTPEEPVHVTLTDGSSVIADLVVAAVGVHPRVIAGADKLALPAGLAIKPAHHWDAARRDGLDAAAQLLGKPMEPRGAPWYWTDRYGHHIEIVGDLTAIGATGAAHDIVRPGNAVFRVDGDSLLGAASIDDPMIVRAARRIIDRGVRVDLKALADPSVSLRQMLRA